MPGAFRTLCAALAVGLLSAGAAGGEVLRGSIVDGTLPAAAAGRSDIRAVDVQTSVIAAATTVPRSGRWSLKVPPGPYSLLTSVLSGSRQRQAITPVVRVKRRGSARVAVSLRRSTTPRRRTQKALPHASVAAPVIAVRNLTATGPFPELGRGFSNMFITEFLDDASPCKPTVVEWEKRDLIQKEIDLGNLVAPGQRLRKRWIEPQIFVEGSLTTTSSGLGTWDVRLRDAATGAIVGGDHGSLPPGGDIFETATQITKRLAEQLCNATYDVAFSLATDNVQAIFEGRGTIKATVTATGAGRAKGIPPTRFTGSAAIAYGDLAFVAKVPRCSFAGATSDQGTLAVTLEVTPAGRLRVTWMPTPLTLAGRSTLVCEGGSFPTPGPGIAGVTPTSFELPVSGGSQAISGDPALAVGGLGIFHSGSIIVTRRSSP